MTSPLAGSLARTIGKAFSGLFLDATLTQAGETYACKAIFDTRSRFLGPGGAVSAAGYRVLVLATTLAVEPVVGAQITLQGQSLVVLSLTDTKPAVSIDPAGAVWTLRCNAFPVGAGAYQSYAAVAAAIGQPFDLHRPTASQSPLASPKLTTLPAQFTNAKSSGFAFNKSAGYDDALFNALIDGTQTQVGDYLIGALTYFVVAMPPNEPISCVQCNRMVGVGRLNSEIGSTGTPLPSQTGGQGRYFGTSRQVVAASGAGEASLASAVPVCILGSTGRATGSGELPADAPGPSRWRISLPQSVFPKGSVRDRDILTDEEGYRYLVSAAVWTVIGYRAEAVREEA